MNNSWDNPWTYVLVFMMALVLINTVVDRDQGARIRALEEQIKSSVASKP